MPIMPTSPATLRWADGRVTRGDIDPTADTVVVLTPDGRFHNFRATDEIDEDGRDVYEEEKG